MKQTVYQEPAPRSASLSVVNCVKRAMRHGWRLLDIYSNGSALLWHRATPYGVLIKRVDYQVCTIERI